MYCITQRKEKETKKRRDTVNGSDTWYFGFGFLIRPSTVLAYCNGIWLESNPSVFRNRFTFLTFRILSRSSNPMRPAIFKLLIIFPLSSRTSLVCCSALPSSANAARNRHTCWSYASVVFAASAYSGESGGKTWSTRVEGKTESHSGSRISESFA
jgi:hypothetical protein